MYYLVKTAGLDLSLYEGELKDGHREGHGVQYFPNGYKFTGMWQGNKANGQGKLEYTDGTFYEGIFKENRISEGMLCLFSGAKFVGKFSNDERHRDRFQEGSFIFTNGDVLKTTWSEGIPKSGQFITKSGRILPFSEKERAVFPDEDDPKQGKIIMANSTEIYEGGLKEKAMNSKGIIYSSFPHYEEVFHINGQLDGNYTCNYIHGGYCYSGVFKLGQRTGKWKYQTVKGYFFEGEPNFKSGTVSFPYLHEDNFKGDVDIQFHNITFRSGTYNFKDATGKYKQIPVQNIKHMTDIPEVAKRKLEVSIIKNRFQKSKIVNEDPVLNGINVYYYPDGSYFRGNFTYDFIYIHKKELPNCFFPKTANHKTSGSQYLTSQKNFSYTQKKLKVVSINEVPHTHVGIFTGSKVKGKMNGFCKLADDKFGLFKGFYLDGKKSGMGKLWGREGEIYSGFFKDDELDGECTILLPNCDIIFANFSDGKLDESYAVIKKRNGLVYQGEIKNLKKDGKGELTYSNGFKFVGNFFEGEINTDKEKGTLINSSGQEFDCVYTVVSGRDMGILETPANNEVFVYSSTQGSLRKAQ